MFTFMTDRFPMFSTSYCETSKFIMPFSFMFLYSPGSTGVTVAYSESVFIPDSTVSSITFVFFFAFNATTPKIPPMTTSITRIITGHFLLFLLFELFIFCFLSVLLKNNPAANAGA